MQIAKLEIENFRGIRQGTVQFSPHTVFVGANNCGKTTVVEALALLFGRDRMIRQLTEHDFYGSNPQPPDRICLVATVIDFDGDDPAQHMDWFRDDRGVAKWWNPSDGAVMPARTDPSWRLACQVAFSARFHRPSLEVETLRYFHDDDALDDVFSEESTTGFPARLIRDIGFFFVPAARTWDRTVSFGSELFRRVVAAGEGQPSESVLSERDRLRAPEARLEQDERLAPIVDRLNLELRGFFRTAPKLHLRVTATDSDGLLESVVSHYAHEGDGLPLPARRHGSGLLSLQHLLLLLQFGRLRAEAQEGFWMALEEPELHVPPALQRRLVHRIQALSQQTFVSTHSPTVAALADPKGVAVLRNDGGQLTSVPLLTSTLPADTPNSVRKLFQVNRVETVAALMHEFVLVPEGRTDYEWIGLLVRAVDLHQSWAAADECRFDAFVGVIPTHDGAVLRTVEAMAPLHPRVVAIVDGDAEGVGYAAALTAAGSPNSGVIIRWANGQMLEDTVGWIIDADADACLAAIQIDNPATTSAELVTRLKTDNRDAGGLKKDTSTYETIAGAIGANAACCARARSLLNAIADLAKGLDNPLFAADANSPAIKVFQP
ncbi:ATP-dependent nuclease [Bradyrhizobium valentinum]|uniref:ATP-dependent nuclease n=1 Tax=Bradyrhizobium valentinum TaxID=1518501 RepID=UPI00070AF40C|nr:AAA family ATPase [Bradyrhizobium valentinum]KRQ93213.1 chromosome partitioning protein [Bradyrhizobium valentinum]